MFHRTICWRYAKICPIEVIYSSTKLISNLVEGRALRITIKNLGRDHSIIFLKLIEVTVNIAISKIATAATSGNRLVKSPLIIRPLTASTA